MDLIKNGHPLYENGGKGSSNAKKEGTVMSKKKTGDIPSCMTGIGARIREAGEHPVMLHRNYDISTSCYRKGDDGQPMELRLQGETEYSLLRALVVIGCTAGGICVLCRIGKMINEAKIRRRCRKKMEARYAEREQRRRTAEAEHALRRETALHRTSNGTSHDGTSHGGTSRNGTFHDGAAL